MSQILLLYQSKYGAAKKYAGWIGEELRCDVLEIKSLGRTDFSRYQIILIAGGVYAGRIAGIKFLRENSGALAHKKTAVFAVGAAPLAEETADRLSKQNQKNFPGPTPIFYGRGALEESRLKLGDRIIFKMLRMEFSKKEPAEAWVKDLLESEQDRDWIDKKYILPLVEYVKREIF